MKDCIFCQIIAKEAPASIVHEDDISIAFMGIRPTASGECMIIPKEHIDHFQDIPDELASHLFLTAQNIARNIQKELDPKRVGYLVNGFGVAHAHLVIIPLEEENQITSSKFANINNGQIIFDESQVQLTSRDELDAIARQIKL
jgi:histidine triad (HIT) family protein